MGVGLALLDISAEKFGPQMYDDPRNWETCWSIDNHLIHPNIKQQLNL